MKLNFEAQRWCLDRGYKIYPVPAEPSKWIGKSIKEFHIIVKYNNERIQSKKIYTNKEWPEVIWSMYEWFYNKYAKKEEGI